MRVFEVIVRNLEEAILAEKFGATRLEVIDDFIDGGCSPKLEVSRDIADAVNIPVNVMVRPHGNGFILSDNDMLVIQREIDYLINKTKINAVVFGSLDDVNKINFVQLKSVCDLLSGSNVKLTFHRAIDCCSNYMASFQELLNYSKEYSQLTHVLTSGGYDSAYDGIDVINQANSLTISKNSSLKIIAGSGLKVSNLQPFLQKCPVSEVHFGSGVRDSGMLLNHDKFRDVLDVLK